MFQDSGTEEDKQKFAEKYSNPYLSIVAICLERALIQDEPEYYLKAIDYVERSKARNLVELLANKDLYPKVELYLNKEEDYQNTCKQLYELRRQIPALQRQLQLSENNPEEVKRLHQLLNELQHQRINLLAAINEVDQDFKYTQKVQPISFEQIQALIGENGAILEWYIACEQFFVFIITPKSKTPIVWRYSQQDRTSLDNLIEEYFTNYGKYVIDKNQKWKSGLSSYLYRLSQILHIEEIIERYILPSDCQQLILIPHRTLHIFPLHALPLVTNNCYLFEKFPQCVRYAPSCQLLQISQYKQRPDFTNLFAIQNPTKDLVYTDIEVESIHSFFPSAQVLVKQAATKTALNASQSLPNAHCTHFSCHGSFNPGSPLESALVLANHERLTLGEIFGLNLNRCRLVTLSACETGLIDFTSTSDEYIGLPSGFLVAGSPAVVSSLWTVNDLSTAFLMIKFYQNIQSGDTVAVALNKAQRWLRDLTVEQLRQWINQSFKSADQRMWLRSKFTNMEATAKLFHEPYYWAAFCAIGQ